MTLFELIAQAIGIVAMVFSIFSYQQKTSRRVIFCQSIAGVLFCVSFFMLGTTVGAILNAVATFRGIVFMYREKFRADHIAWLVAFILMYIASYVLTFTVFGKEFTLGNAVVELLPVIGMSASTIGFRKNNARAIRRYSLICSPCWLVYNIVAVAAGAIICETLSLVSIFIGIWRHDRNKNSEAQL